MSENFFVPFDIYLENSRRFKKKRSERWAQRIYSQFLPKKFRILEIGSGPGFLIRELSRLSPSNVYFSMDIHFPALQWQMLCSPPPGSPPICCIQNSPYSFPFRNNQFDLIISEDCLHCLDFMPFVTEIIRILKPGGSALLMDIDIDKFIYKLIRIKKIFFNFFKFASLNPFEKAFIHAVEQGYKKENLQEHLKQIKNIRYLLDTINNCHYIEIVKL